MAPPGGPTGRKYKKVPIEDKNENIFLEKKSSWISWVFSFMHWSYWAALFFSALLILNLHLILIPIVTGVWFSFILGLNILFFNYFLFGNRNHLDDVLSRAGQSTGRRILGLIAWWDSRPGKRENDGD